jgi:hypothetical protein
MTPELRERLSQAVRDAGASDEGHDQLMDRLERGLRLNPATNLPHNIWPSWVKGMDDKGVTEVASIRDSTECFAAMLYMTLTFPDHYFRKRQNPRYGFKIMGRKRQPKDPANLLGGWW